MDACVIASIAYQVLVALGAAVLDQSCLRVAVLS